MYDDGEYLACNPGWHEEDAPYKARWIAQFLAQQRLSPHHIVEIGSGSGEVLVQLHSFFPEARLEGWDISPQAHAIAEKKAGPHLAFHLGDWPGTGADLLMVIDVVEHIEDYMGFLRAVKRASGMKLFHIPLDLSAQGLLVGKGLLRTRAREKHLHYFCQATALATLRDCGFEIQAWRYTHGAEELPNRRLRTRMLSLLRKALRVVNEDFTVRALGGASLLVLAR